MSWASVLKHFPTNLPLSLSSVEPCLDNVPCHGSAASKSLILHKELPSNPCGLLMNNGCRIESGGNANYREIIPIHYFDPSILKLKMQHKNNKVFAANSADCRALWKHVGVCFLLFSLLLADRIGEEVELQISFLLFCCLWSLPTESTLTKSRTLLLMLNWVNKLCMKLCRSL